MLREQRLSCLCEMPHSDIKLPKKGKCILEVRSREGRDVPHFHIIGKSKKFYCAVCLDTAKYFKHGKWVDELNNEQKEKLHIAHLNVKVILNLLEKKQRNHVWKNMASIILIKIKISERKLKKHVWKGMEIKIF